MGVQHKPAAGALAVQTGKPVLLVVAHLDEADDAYEDLALLEQAGYTLQRDRLSALEVLPGETHASLELLAERLAVVERLVKRDVPARLSSGSNTVKSEFRNPTSEILIAPIQALMQPVPLPDALGDFSIVLETGKYFAPGQLLDWLDRAGYQRVDAIEQPGDFTTRGGIVDVYLPSSANVRLLEGSTAASSSLPPSAGPLPVRIDYFGDEIDSLSVIDTDTLGSSTRLQSVQLIGASLAQIQNDDRTTSLLELLPVDALVVLHELMEISEQARGYYERLTSPRGIIAPNTLLSRLTQRKHVHFTQYGHVSDKQASIELPVRPLPVFAQEAAPAIKELAALSVSDSVPETPQVVVLCQKEAEQTRLRELLNEHAPGPSNTIELTPGYLHRGFVWATSEAGNTSQRDIDESALYLVPHHELFHRYMTRRRIRKVSTGASTAQAGGKPVDAFLDIAPGDFVVHVDHGIARFVEMRTIRRGGVTEDYLTSSLLKVPVCMCPPRSLIWCRNTSEALKAGHRYRCWVVNAGHGKRRRSAKRSRIWLRSCCVCRLQGHRCRAYVTRPIHPGRKRLKQSSPTRKPRISLQPLRA
ncbi:MAG: hypothetical protein HC898_03635 [Phycisphaerales bacterium]|nr:hypothetical protein [Phycisphaerales bacterium]